MAVKDAIIENTLVKNENGSSISKVGLGTTPLNSEIYNRSMFCKIAFDYLSFTIPFHSSSDLDFKKSLDLLYLDKDKAESIEFGRNGYKSSIRWKNELDQPEETYSYFFHGGSQSTNNK